MNKVQALRYQTYDGIRAFLAGLTLGAGPVLDALVTRFLAALARVEEAIQVQDSADAEAHTLTARIDEAKQLLFADYLRQIVHGAEVLYGRKAVETASFRMPGVNAPVVELLAAAGTLAEAATPIEAELVKHGLKPDFLAGLRAQVAEIHELATRRTVAIRRRAGARAAIRDGLSEASTVVAHLNALFVTALRDDPKLLAEWRSAIRVADAPVLRAREKSEAAAAKAAPAPDGPAAAPVASAAPEPVAPSTGEATA